MIILLIFVLILLLSLSIIITKQILNPLNIYLVYWFLLLLLSINNPAGLFNVSNYTYLIILVSIILFSFGFLTYRKKSASPFIGKIYNFQNLFQILNYILISILIYYILKYFSILKYMDIEKAREIRFTIGYLFTNYIEYVFFNYIISSLLYFEIVYYISYYLIFRRINSNIVFVLINLVIYAFIGLGRFIVFDFILFCVLGFIVIMNEPRAFFKKINNNITIDKFKYFLKLIFLASIVFSILVVITSVRTGGKIDSINKYIYWSEYLLNQGIIYLVGPFRTLDYFLQSNVVSRIGYTLGRSTFSGIEELCNNIFLIFGVNIININSVLSSITDSNLVIGSNGTAINAFYTGVMNFYLDGGIITVMLFSFLLGLCVSLFWKEYLIKNDIINLSFLIIIIKTSLAYSYRNDFSSPLVWLVLLYLFILKMITVIKEKEAKI